MMKEWILKYQGERTMEREDKGIKRNCVIYILYVEGDTAPLRKCLAVSCKTTHEIVI